MPIRCFIRHLRIRSFSVNLYDLFTYRFTEDDWIRCHESYDMIFYVPRAPDDIVRFIIELTGISESIYRNEFMAFLKCYDLKSEFDMAYDKYYNNYRDLRFDMISNILSDKDDALYDILYRELLNDDRMHLMFYRCGIIFDDHAIIARIRSPLQLYNILNNTNSNGYSLAGLRFLEALSDIGIELHNDSIKQLLLRDDILIFLPKYISKTRYIDLQR